MKIDKKTSVVKFVRRPNRFQGYVMVDGVEELVHVPNTGRLSEILIPGVDALIRHEDGKGRKTRFSLIAAWKGDTLINFDSQGPNKLVEEALKKGKIKHLKEYNVIEREKKFGSSRFDFRLRKLDEDGNETAAPYFLEVKGVTLERNGIVSFPDAKTQRGARHLMELALAKGEGYGAGVIFVVQLKGASHFSPASDKDVDFTKALIHAKKSGVDIMCFDCIVKTDEIELDKEVLVKIDER